MDEGPSGSDSPAPQHRIPVVAIGASAGGLSAVKEFLTKLPARPEVAVVVLMHLSPEYESHLEEILQQHTRMPVRQVNRNVEIRKNRVYVIPPSAYLESIDTHLHLTPQTDQTGNRAPIDRFFRSLAQSHADRAVGVVLSGTGSDGVIGLRHIRGRGGLTVVQDPEEAEYDGMPRNAIRGGVDLVLPVARMPAAIRRFLGTRPRFADLPAGDGISPQASASLHEIFALLRGRTGRDFSQYKPSTMTRRIFRRMQFNAMTQPGDYLELLRKRPDELRALSEDLLITVTSFFRDKAVFDLLASNVIPGLFEGKASDDIVRVWCVGCATGEEAYSIAMLLAEEARRRTSPPTMQIFASDLHADSLEQAREGSYPRSIEEDVAPARLNAFFVKENGNYRVTRALREMVVFTPHNLLADPPFSRLDLVSCRNLLIYLQRNLQRKVIELLHYSLRPGGILVLGTSESMDRADLFRTEDKKHSLFRKRDVPAPSPRLPVFPLLERTAAVGHSEPLAGDRGKAAALGRLHLRLLEQCGPPSVLVAPNDEVVHFSAHAGRYFLQPGGEHTANVFKLTRDELRMELRTAFHSVRKGGAPVRTRPMPVRLGGDAVRVEVDVRPATEPEHEGFILLTFLDSPAHAHTPDPDPEGGTSGESVSRPSPAATMRELEQEKELAEQRLQTLIREYETSREETQSSNEELQSANEELRSTLEELETSKEELQSMNEELQTVNQENLHKVEELAHLSSDLQNLLVATDIATLFLDREMRIQRFTPRMAELFNLQQSDRGRPLSDLSSPLQYDSLLEDATGVLERLAPVERQVSDKAGRWHLLRILPYRTTEDVIAGVVVTFIDITTQKQAEVEIRRAKESLEQILPEPLLMLTSELRVRSANAAFYRYFKTTPEETLGHPVTELGDGQWNLPKLRRALLDVLPDNKSFEAFVVDHVFPHLGRRVLHLSGRQLSDQPLILLGMHDVTGFQRLSEEQELVNRRKNEFLGALSHELRNPLASLKYSLAILQRAPADSEAARRALTVMDRQTTQLGHLVNDLMDITRIARAKMEIHPVPLDLVEETTRIVEDHRALFERCGMSIELVLDVPAITVNADSTRLSQVLGNLLQNAAKFRREAGTARVIVGAEGDDALIRVQDDGIGMEPKTLGTLFEPFVQAKDAAVRSRGGLGLGLALSRQLIELHGGTIAAHSKGLGKGSEFCVRLPVHRGPAQKPQDGKERGPLGRPRRILVIEDMADEAETLQMALGLDGHDVATARDGLEGLAKARELEPEVIVCDLGLPGIDGYEVARRIRAEARFDAVLLVALSGYARPEDADLALKAGFDIHMAKPPSMDQLKEIVRRGRGD